MAHFAEINNYGHVIRVIVISNEVLLDSENKEQENLGIEFCKSLYGESTNWVQTSYGGNFRKKFAGINDTFDSVNNIFVTPRPGVPPYLSWSLDENFDWQPPVEDPSTEDKAYAWNESLQKWEE